ncbi:hypothetical protein GLYMA_15G073150v4 [Glycine max]|nr:hypothetical protein GLYMA_15G073150v4 [Glycine max]KAG4381080.1 hypothetical protein GLYMA_15G073150v4 [Glycine max]KAH1146030.1 hypothetical protein GYH30_041626 [Glycine max]KAH1146031.1 hypothetical protein GYH30_041626 [Glycine max]
MPNKIFIAIIQSLRKLLDRSNMASGKRTAVLGDSAGRFTDMKPKSEAPSTQRKSQDLNLYQRIQRTRKNTRTCVEL